MKNVRSIDGYILITLIIVFISPELMAKNFANSVRGLEGEIKQVLMVAGPLALMFAGGAFYISKRIGTELLTSAGIGILIFAASGSIFQMIYRVFS